MSSALDISHEFLICRHLNGFKLVSHEVLAAHRKHQLCLYPIASVDGVLRSPFSVYFTSESVIHEVNDACLTALNLSRKKVLKQRYSSLMSEAQQVQMVMANDEWIIENECQKIFHENVALINNTIIQVVSFKAPWYDEASRVQGIFGCSVFVDSNEFMQTIDNIITLSNLFLLSNQSVRRALLGRQIQGNYFTRREIDVIQQVVQGKTLREVAESLKLSIRTIESYFDHIKVKAGVSTKSALIQLIRDLSVKL